MVEEKKHSKYVNIFHNKYTAWLVLFLSLLLTLSASYLTFNYSNKIAKERFIFRANDIAMAVEFRMAFYEQALRGGVGLFNSNKVVTRQMFNKYVESLKMSLHLPGIQGIGYSIPVKKEYKESHINEIKAEGFPDYTIKPETEREEYSAIIYLEPFDWRNKRAFGYDMWSNDMRRKAMTRARDSSLAATSGIITLVQETDKNVQKGFLMYLPVYETQPQTLEERRTFFQGWVYSAFRAGDLMHGILGATDLEYGFELYDGNEINNESLLFDSDTVCHLYQKNDRSAFSKIIGLKLQGRDWKLYFHTKPNVLSSKERNLPLLIAIFGLVIDFILFFVIFSLNQLQRQTEKMSLKLAVQKDDLENVNKDLSQFAYLTSHDLQEPLRTVSNYIKLLEEDYGDKLDTEGKLFLQTIFRATHRMSSLIHAILEYSRIGKIGKNNDLVNCQGLIEEVEDDLAALIKINKAVLLYDNLPTVIGNEAMLKQLFANLISNAIRYKQVDVAPIVKITVINLPLYYQFKVEDNGKGIDEKYFERIFRIFQRLHTQAEYKGTGIGLSSCRKIVELHGGKIWVTSVLDKGSIFIFTIKKK